MGRADLLDRAVQVVAVVDLAYVGFVAVVAEASHAKGLWVVHRMVVADGAVAADMDCEEMVMELDSGMVVPLGWELVVVALDCLLAKGKS